jgi:hypothetical protein
MEGAYAHQQKEAVTSCHKNKLIVKVGGKIVICCANLFFDRCCGCKKMKYTLVFSFLSHWFST